MNESTDRIAAWASILGSVVALLGLLQSQSWIVMLGGGCLGVSVAMMAYARRTQRVLRSAGIEIEGLNLDSLNIANLRRRLNRSLVVQEAYHLARIEGRTLTIAWKYDGFCRSKRETSMEFSIDAENSAPIEQMNCFAYDLKEDPHRLHKIQPMLIGGEGLSKKIAVPFLKPLLEQQPFSVLLHCTLPDCVGPGLKYYSSTLSFAQRHVARLAVHLVFVRGVPDWVRVYGSNPGDRLALLSELRPFKNDGETCEYVDLVERTPGQSVRVYVYRMPSGMFITSRSEPKMLT